MSRTEYKSQRNQPLSAAGDSQSEESQDWIFSYADLMSLLLGFFIIMFAFSEIDPKKAMIVSESIGGSFLTDKGIAEIKKKQQDRENLDQGKILAQFESFTDEIKKSLGLQSMDVSMDLDMQSLSLTLPDRVYFASASEKLSEESRQALASITTVAKENSHVKRIEIVGHTDPRPLRSGSRFEDNMILGAARAAAVAREFIGQGYPRDRVAIRGITPEPVKNLSELTPAELEKMRHVELVFYF